MKLWMRYSAGIVLGIVVGSVLPIGDGTIIGFLSQLGLNVGRYTILPLLFFLIPVSVFTLLEEKRLASVGLKTLLYIGVAAVAGVMLGGLLVIVLSPQRIPIIMADAAAPHIPVFQELVLQVFPANAMVVLWGEGAYLLPPVVLALLLGFGFAKSHSFSEPVLDMFDSAARLMYTINSWIVAITGILLIPITAEMVLFIRGIDEFGLFSEVLFASLFGAGLVLFIGVPLAVYVLGKRGNPVTFLFSILPPAAAAAVSGNHVFALTTLMRTGRNNQGISRKAESVVYTLSTLFCRAGTAMIAMIAFVVVMRSYSSLEISLFQVVLVGVSTMLISVMLGAMPGGDILVLMALLSTLHGRGIPEGYLILLPLVPLLIRVGAAVDVTVAAAIAQIVGVRSGMCKTVSPHHFI